MFRILSMFLFCLVVIDGRYFRNDYTFHPEVGGWMKLHRMPAGWNEARVRCHLEGAVLLSPLNMDLWRAMTTMMDQMKIDGVFTGISASYSKGDYFSIEGISLEHTKVAWANGEPNNNLDNEQCTFMQSRGYLFDCSCEAPYPYICFKKNNEDMPVPHKCGTVDLEYKYDYRTSHCYKFHRIAKTWSRAFMTCAAEGGHLAIINSVEEAEVLKKLFAKNPGNKIMSKHDDSAFIGFRAENNTYDWLTVHGQTLEEAGYGNWSHGRPRNYGSCGAIGRTALLKDIKCNHLRAFICEKTPGSLLDNNNGTTTELATKTNAIKNRL